MACVHSSRLAIALALLALGCGATRAGSSHAGGGAAGAVGGAGGTSGANAGGTGGAESKTGSGSSKSGSMGDAGHGGTLPVVCTQSVAPSPACGETLCGNDARDSCELMGLGGGPPTTTLTEVCDGGELDGKSCESLGYASGTLACSASCHLETVACFECVEGATAVSSCGAAPVSTVEPYAVGIAATDAEVALAWLGRSAEDSEPSVRFARLSPTFELLSETKLDTSCSVDGLAGGVAVAALADGWVVGVYSPPEILLHTVDANGHALTRTVVDTVERNTFFGGRANPLFASAPDGTQLMVWQTGAVVRVAVVAADGQTTTTPIDVPLDGLHNEWGASAAFVGDAFYLPFSVSTSTTTGELRVVRVEADGSSASVSHGLPGEFVAMVTLVGSAGAGELYIAYEGTDAEDVAMLWRRIDTKGAALSEPVVLDDGSTYLGPSPGFGWDGDRMVLLTAGQSRLGFARVSSTGVVTTPIAELARGPYMVWYDMARVGSEVVVAWLQRGPVNIEVSSLPDHIGLARVTP